jgi:two-component system, NarL family, response regulator DevR
VRNAVRLVLIGEDDFDVVGEAGTIADARSRLGPAAPDVVILDVHLPDGSGIDLCRALSTKFPSLACLILTAATDLGAPTAARHVGVTSPICDGADLAGFEDERPCSRNRTSRTVISTEEFFVP